MDVYPQMGDTSMRHTGHGGLPFCMWLPLPMVSDRRISKPEADRSILTNRMTRFAERVK